MASRRYRAGIIASYILSRTGDWPAEVPGLGRKRGGHPLERCYACPADRHPERRDTFVHYGDVPLCKEDACMLAGGGDLPFVREVLARVQAARAAAKVLESGESRGAAEPGDRPDPSAGRAHYPNPPAAFSRPEGLDSREVDPCRHVK